jgi:hypothetical protein
MPTRRRLLVTSLAAAAGLSGCIGEGGVSLEVSEDAVELPRSEFRLTLRNNSDGVFRTGTKGWRLLKLTDTGPVRVLPVLSHLRSTRLSLESGEEHTWKIEVDAENDGYTWYGERTDDGAGITGLTPGEYELRVNGRVEGDLRESGITVSAPLEVTGEGPGLTPTDGVLSVGEKDGVLGITEEMTDDSGIEGIEVERSPEDGADAKTLILAQVLQLRPLRNAVYHLRENGGNVARVETTEAHVDTVIQGFEVYGVGDSTDEEYVFRFDGETYHVSVAP